MYIFHMSIFDEDCVPIEDNARYLVRTLVNQVQGRLKDLFVRYYVFFVGDYIHSKAA